MFGIRWLLFSLISYTIKILLELTTWIIFFLATQILHYMGVGYVRWPPQPTVNVRYAETEHTSPDTRIASGYVDFRLILCPLSEHLAIQTLPSQWIFITGVTHSHRRNCKWGNTAGSRCCSGGSLASLRLTGKKIRHSMLIAHSSCWWCLNLRSSGFVQGVDEPKMRVVQRCLRGYFVVMQKMKERKRHYMLFCYIFVTNLCASVLLQSPR